MQGLQKQATWMSRGCRASRETAPACHLGFVALYAEQWTLGMTTCGGSARLPRLPDGGIFMEDLYLMVAT